jgi:hypothetical protein
MRKILMAAIPIVTLVLFILVMLSGNILKMPLGTDDNIPEAINDIVQKVQQDKWDEVSSKTEELAAIWKKIVFRVQFSSERDEINFFSTNIARLQGAVLAKDKTNALMELQEAYDHWAELGN